LVPSLFHINQECLTIWLWSIMKYLIATLALYSRVLNLLNKLLLFYLGYDLLSSFCPITLTCANGDSCFDLFLLVYILDCDLMSLVGFWCFTSWSADSFWACSMAFEIADLGYKWSIILKNSYNLDLCPGRTFILSINSSLYLLLSNANL
jgi:hypothetical protein